MRQFGLTSLAVASITISGCNNAVPPTAPDAMLVDPAMSPAGSGVTGTWRGVDHSAQGSVRFKVQNGVASLDFSADFSVSAVPGPFVYMNTTNNANTGSPLRVSSLRSNKGAQSYVFRLPPGVRYTWVLVWCDPFNVPVAEAQIPATP